MIELGGGGKFVGGPKVVRKVRRFFERLHMLTGWPGYLTIFSPPKREYSSVRAILQSELEAQYLQGKTKGLIIRLKTRDELLPCKEKPKRIL
jgi:hypothetical protein